MTEGISLNFDADNNASVEVKDELQQCFGAVMCPFCKYKQDQILLDNKLVDIEFEGYVFQNNGIIHNRKSIVHVNHGYYL